MERRKITVKHLVASDDGGPWPPTDAKLFLEWFEYRMSEIPEAWRDSAKISVCMDETPGYEGDHVAQISITYMRDESDAEFGLRKIAEEAFAERDIGDAERVERQILAELKRKYES